MADQQGKNLAEHHAAVTVNAPVHQVYALFSHFNDFPKFMSFVKEVTYYDDQNSHWVADVVGRHEWDAVNENWVPDQQIGWRSTKGLENAGRVTFHPTSANQTLVDVYINYNPPAGVLGDIGESLGAGQRFESALQQDLNNFARMVEQSPPGALDPASSNYLFREGSAADRGATTERQEESMRSNPSARQGSGAASAASGWQTGNQSMSNQQGGTQASYQPDQGYNAPPQGYTSTNNPNTMPPGGTGASSYNPASGRPEYAQGGGYQAGDYRPSAGGYNPSAGRPEYSQGSAPAGGAGAPGTRPTLDRDIIEEPAESPRSERDQGY